MRAAAASSFPLQLMFIAFAASSIVGCDAGFTDLRQVHTPLEVPDGGFLDAGDLDGGAPPEPRVVRRGIVIGRDGHNGGGSVELVDTGTGFELRFGADFTSSRVPGPVVVMSPRDDLGSRLRSEDIELGTLSSASGAQSYAVPPSAVDLAYAWVFCKPFGVEVVRAQLEEVP